MQVKLEKTLKLNDDTFKEEIVYYVTVGDRCLISTKDEERANRGYTAAVEFVKKHGNVYPINEILESETIETK